MRPGLMNARKPAKRGRPLMRPRDTAREPGLPATVERPRWRATAQDLGGQSRRARRRFDRAHAVAAADAGFRLRSQVRGRRRRSGGSPELVDESRSPARRSGGPAPEMERQLVAGRQEQEEHGDRDPVRRTEVDPGVRGPRRRPRAPRGGSAETRSPLPCPCSRRARASRVARRAPRRPLRRRRRRDVPTSREERQRACAPEDGGRRAAGPRAPAESSRSRRHPAGRSQHSGTISPKSPSRLL
jgi:hypothetical protein